jgi:hypothetical protein
VTSRRPTFWWFLEPGVTGARVQLCTRRDCATVTATWDASGDHLRAPTELPVGVHFWRLFARRGDAVDPTPGLLWEFEVPSTPQRIRGYGAEGMHAIGDVNGDGDGDAATVQGVAYGTGAGFVPAAGPIFVPPSSWMAYSATFRASSVGDLDGDGLGDHVRWLTEVFLAPDPHHLTAGSLRLGAGGTTLIPWPQRQAVAWAWGDVRGEGRTRFFTLLLESAGTSTLEESGPGAGALVRVANCVTATAAMTLDAADFDGDGDDDLRARYSPTIVGSANGGPAGLGTWTCGP